MTDWGETAAAGTGGAVAPGVALAGVPTASPALARHSAAVESMGS